MSKFIAVLFLCALTIVGAVYMGNMVHETMCNASEKITGTTTHGDTCTTTTANALNGSSDGRYHTCGYITEDGVTEYLDVYAARCGANR